MMDHKGRMAVLADKLKKRSTTVAFRRAVSLLAVTVLALGCRQPVGTLGASLGLDRLKTGSVELGIVIPKESLERARSTRQVQYLPVALTKSVRVTITPSDPALPTVVKNEDLVPASDPVTGDQIATVTVNAVPEGNNFVVDVEVYEDPGQTGRRFETLRGVLDIDPATSPTVARVNWRTTVAAEAMSVLLARGERQRLIARSISKAFQVASAPYEVGDPVPGESLQYLADAVIDRLNTATPVFHPSLINGEPLGHLIISHTARQPGYEALSSGYALPPTTDPGLYVPFINEYKRVFSTALDVQIFDMRGQPATDGVEVWIEEPASEYDASAPFDFHHIHPNTSAGWPVSARQIGAVTRTSSFPRAFNAGATTDLKNVLLAGRTFAFASSTVTVDDPTQAAFDASGALYVADTGRHRILKIAPDGTETVFAGQTDISSSAPDASGTPANLGDGGPATGATFKFPEGLAVEEDAGVFNVYIADTGNHRVRRVRGADGVIETVIGDGIAGYGPSGDNTDTGFAYRLPGQTPAPFRLNTPRRLAIIGTGAGRTLFVHDTNNFRMRALNLNGTSITTELDSAFSDLSDTSPALAAARIAGKDYLFYCGKVGTQEILRYYEIGTAGWGLKSLMGSSSTLLEFPQLFAVKPANAKLHKVLALAADSYGNIYVSDAWNSGNGGRVIYLNPWKLTPGNSREECFMILGSDAPGDYAPATMDGKSALAVTLGLPRGLALPTADPAYNGSLFVSTGGTDDALIEVKVW